MAKFRKIFIPDHPLFLFRNKQLNQNLGPDITIVLHQNKDRIYIFANRIEDIETAINTLKSHQTWLDSFYTSIFTPQLQAIEYLIGRDFQNLRQITDEAGHGSIIHLDKKEKHFKVYAYSQEDLKKIMMTLAQQECQYLLQTNQKLVKDTIDQFLLSCQSKNIYDSVDEYDPYISTRSYYQTYGDGELPLKKRRISPC